ncbi:MAG: hypothetical protein PHH09_04625 [Methanoregulaceae archaeon]|nr:hypothetical protein [Methanoregulaceae archaeon]
MTYAKPSRDKFPNRGRWSPAQWANRKPAKITNPPPKADDYRVYEDWNIPDVEKDYIGNIKVEIAPGSTWAGVYYYPVLHKGEGYENGLLHTHPGYPATPGHDYYEPIRLAPRLVAIVTGKTRTKVLARARREALYLSTEPDEIGPRIVSPVQIDTLKHEIRRASPSPGVATA